MWPKVQRVQLEAFEEMQWGAALGWVRKAEAASRFPFIPRNLEDLLTSAELRPLLRPRQPRITAAGSCIGTHAVCRAQMVHLISFINLDVIFSVIEWVHHPRGSVQSPVPKSDRRSGTSVKFLKYTYHLLIKLTQWATPAKFRNPRQQSARG